MDITNPQFQPQENESADAWIKRITGQPSQPSQQSPAAGLFDFASGIYNRNAGQSDAASRLATAQGPLYSAAMSGAMSNLNQAGAFNPDAFAANRFAANRALVAPVQQKQLDDLQRRMYATGTMGTATYNPGIPGITPNGTPMSPQLAAFYAAQNADNSATAYNSMQQGNDQLNQILSRAGLLQNTAANAQGTGLQAQMTQPSRAASNAQLLSGAKSIFQLPGVKDKINGMLGQGASWLFGQQDPLKTFDFNYDPSEGAAGDFNF